MRWLSGIVFLLMSFTAVFGTLAQDVLPKPVSVFGVAVETRMSPDGQMFATFENRAIHNDEVYPTLLPIHVYNASSGTHLLSLVGERDYAVDVAISDDSRRMAALYPTGWLHVWDLTTGEPITRLPIAPNGGRLAWVPGQNQIVVASLMPSSIQVWDLDSGDMVDYLTPRFTTLLEQKEASRNGLPDNLAAFAVAPDGDSFAVVTIYGNVQVWEMSGAFRTLHSLNLEQPQYPFRYVTFTGDGERVLTAHTREDRILILDAETGQMLNEIAAPGIRHQRFALSANGEQAAWLEVGDDDSVTVWLADMTTGETTEYPLAQVAIPRISPMTALYFTADRSRLLLAHGDIIDEPSDNVIWMLSLPE